MQKKSPEQKMLFGWRETDSDGFTYRYGKFKNGYKKTPHHNKGIKISKRNDKRSVKAKSLKRDLDEMK